MTFDANGHSVQYVGNNPQLVDLLLQVDDNSDYVILDLHEINDEIGGSYASIDLPLSTCQYNESTNQSTCLVSNLPLKPGRTEITLYWEHWKGGGRTRGNQSFTFEEDTTQPRVTSMTTEHCRDGACYIGSGIPTTVTITLDDETGTFNQRLIFYAIGTASSPVGQCEERTCTDTMVLSCGDNTPLDMKVVNGPSIPSQDDAGNPVANPGEVTRVWCDATPPEIVEITAKGTGLLDMVTNDGELHITAIVEEQVTIASMIANTHDVQFNVSENETLSVSCERLENALQRCELVVGNLEAGTNKEVPLTFVDEVGNKQSALLEIPRILRVANETNAPRFFSATATSTAPERINRVALQLAMENAMEYPHYISYELIRTTAGAKILHQEMDPASCEVVWHPERNNDPFRPSPGENWSVGSALYNEIAIFFPNADWDEANRIDASFLEIEDVDERDADTILVRCNLTLTVEKDDVLYQLPEIETLYWPVNLKNSALGTPGEAFLEKINKQEDTVTGDVYQLIGYANQLMSTMAQLCEIQGIFNMISTQGMTMEAMGTLLIWTGAGQGLAQGGSNIQGQVKAYSMQYLLGKMGSLDIDPTGLDVEDRGLGRKMCDFVHCNTAQAMENQSNMLVTADSSFLSGLSESGVGNSMALGPYVQNLNQPDVQNSLIMSLATQCWGGVVHNLNKYRLIECGHLVCLKEQALGGNSVAPCDAAKGAAICRFVLGELFELPYARVLSNLMENIQHVMQAPIGLLFNWLDQGPCSNMDYEIGWGPFACHVMQGFRMIEEFRSITESTTLFTWDASPDLCDLALCEGDECNRPTNSFLNQLFPEASYAGPALTRQRMLEEWKAKQRRDENDALLKVLGGDPKKDDDNWDGKTLTSEMNDYADHAGIDKDEETRRDFFKGIMGKGGSDYCTKKQDDCLADFARLLEEGNAPKDLASYKSANLVGTSLVSEDAIEGYNAYIENKCDDIKECLVTAACKQNPISSTNCEKEVAANKELRKQLEGYQIKGEQLCKGDLCIDAASAQDREAYKRKVENSQEWYNFVEGLSGVIAQGLYAQGKLDWLTIKGLGSFGTSIDELAQDLPFTTSWQENLCNPTGSFGSLTEDDGAVYAWQQGTYRPVLTFAGERLPLGSRAFGLIEQHLYTASFVVISPVKENSLVVTLEPGALALHEGSITVAAGNLPESRGFSLNSTKNFEEVCITFSEPFPDSAGERKFCRPLAEDAYDRGVVTNETLPGWGVEDPYGGYTAESTQGNGIGNFLGFGGGG
jgi:hypothetical protein